MGGTGSWSRLRLVGAAAAFAASIATVLASTDLAFAATTIPKTTYTQSTTWTAAGSPYVVTGDVTVAGGATLTMEPGVIVKFGYVFAVPRKIVIASGGGLQANGTAGSPITFTSIKDDTVEGDTGVGAPPEQPESTRWR